MLGHGKVWISFYVVRLGTAWYGGAWHGLVGISFFYGTVGFGTVRRGVAWHGLDFGEVRSGSVLLGRARSGWARLGMAWSGRDFVLRFGLVGHG